MILKLVAFAVGTTLVFVILKDSFPSMAVVLSVAGCVCIAFVSLEGVRSLGNILGALVPGDGASADAVEVIARVLGIAYLTSFGSDVCADAGARAIANVLETAGKLIMLSMALPMLCGIFRSVAGIIGW